MLRRLVAARREREEMKVGSRGRQDGFEAAAFELHLRRLDGASQGRSQFARKGGAPRICLRDAEGRERRERDRLPYALGEVVVFRRDLPFPSAPVQGGKGCREGGASHRIVIHFEGRFLDGNRVVPARLNGAPDREGIASTPPVVLRRFRTALSLTGHELRRR
ncbi:MAG: hypothetical protein ABW133_15010 [Polyangiaceae bacterium]